MVHLYNRILCKYFFKCRNSLCINIERLPRHFKLKKQNTVQNNMSNILTSLQKKGEENNINLYWIIKKVSGKVTNN